MIRDCDTFKEMLRRPEISATDPAGIVMTPVTWLEFPVTVITVGSDGSKEVVLKRQEQREEELR